MTREEFLLKIVRFPYVSEKSSALMDKFNTVVFRVARNATKNDIKIAVNKLFAVEISDVHTLIVKGKIKHHGKYCGYRNNWKKAYVTLKEGQKMNFIEYKE